MQDNEPRQYILWDQLAEDTHRVAVHRVLEQEMRRPYTWSVFEEAGALSFEDLRRSLNRLHAEQERLAAQRVLCT